MERGQEVDTDQQTITAELHVIDVDQLGSGSTIRI